MHTIYNCHGMSMISCGNENTKLTDDSNSSAYYFVYTEADMSASYTAMLAKDSKADIGNIYTFDKSSSVTMRQCLTDDKSKHKSIKVAESSELIIEGQKNLPSASQFKISSNSSVISYLQEGVKKIIDGVWKKQ